MHFLKGKKEEKQCELSSLSCVHTNEGPFANAPEALSNEFSLHSLQKLAVLLTVTAATAATV